MQSVSSSMDIDSNLDVVNKLDKDSTARSKEDSNRAIALSDSSIFEVLDAEYCQPTLVRDGPNMSIFMCSDNCLRNLDCVPDAKKAIRNLRELLWMRPVGTKVSCDPRNVGRDMITCQLLSILFSNVTCNSDGSKHVSFRIGMHEVCKYFYRLASGINERKFNDTLRYVLNFDVPNREHSTFDNILNGKLFNSLFGACPASE